MHRIVPSITSLDQHLLVIHQTPDPYRPQRCPHCGLGVLWRHGCYRRKVDRARSYDPSRSLVAIRRYCCAGCRRTCSRLPTCIAPRRWHDWSAQHAALYRLMCGQSVHRCSRETQLQRHTVRRWRDGLTQRGEQFAFLLRSRFASCAHGADFSGFWKNLLAAMPLSDAMAWLDRHLDIP